MERFGFWETVRSHRNAAVIAVLGLIIALAVVATTTAQRGGKEAEADMAQQPRRVGNLYYPAPKQWTAISTDVVEEQTFRAEHLTDGKISVDEDKATLVYSPYSGRAVKLLAKPGEQVSAGQALFVVEAPDMVQAQNDFINAVAGLNKARSALDLAKIVEQQNKTLLESHAAPLRDYQQAQAAKSAAENDVRAAETALAAARNRLHIFGKTDEEITAFANTGAISPLTTIYSPIDGTVVQRKVGPGQYVNTASNSPAANDATFVIGDLSTVWLIAYVRESDAPSVRVGQPMRFTVLAYPDREFVGEVKYVAASLDSSTRRLLVRATLDNKEGLLRPEMFASVKIATGEPKKSAAVPRDAVVFDGKTARVWVVRDDQSLEPREVKTGLVANDRTQILEGLQPGEKVVTKGSLFVEHAVAGS